MTQLQKWLYALGNLGSTLSTQAVSTYLGFFYLTVMKMDLSLYGIGMLLYTGWNVINDPLAGAISDKTRTRWGRRIPYILFGTLPMAIFFMLLWAVPAFFAQDPLLLFVYFLVILFFLDGLSSIIGLNYTALFPEMFTTLEERAEVSPMRQVFSLAGAVAGIALPPIVYATLGWGWMGVLFGVLMALSLFLSLKGMRERANAQKEEALPIREALGATFRNRSFLIYIGSQIMNQFGFFLIMAAIPFYAQYVLQVAEQTTSLILATAFIAAFPMVFVWGRITTRLGARAAMMAALALFALALVPLLFVTDVTGTLITTAAVGMALGGVMILPDILLSDVIDEDEQKTGKRREGMYYGIQGLLIRSSIFLVSATITVTLYLTGFDADLSPGAQPAAVATGIRWMTAVGPILGCLIAIVFMWFYPLHGKRLDEIHAGPSLLETAETPAAG